MTKTADQNTTFKYLDVLVRSVQPDPNNLSAQNVALSKSILVRYNKTRVDLKSFTFSAGSKILSIDNAVLGPIPKRLLFNIIMNANFTGLLDSTSTNFGSKVSINIRCW